MDYDGMTDLALWVLWRDQQDQGAMTHLWERHYHALFGRARRLLRDEARAADAVQEMWLRACQHAQEPNRPILLPWFMTILGRVCLDVRKRRDGRIVLGTEFDYGKIPDPGNDPFARLAGAEEREQLRRCIEQLPAELRKIVELRYGGEEIRTFEQIAESLTIPLATVYGRWRNALRLLGACLNPQE